MQVAAAAQGRGQNGDSGHDGGEGEGQVHAVGEGLFDQLGEERAAGDVRGLAGRQVLQRSGGAEQLLDRVVAQEGREEAADRRLVGHDVGRAGSDPGGDEPAVQVAGQA